MNKLGTMLGLAVATAALGCSGAGGPGVQTDAPARSGADATYYVYVGAESADLMHRVRFGPGGASVERTVPVGEMSVETEGPHGFITSPNGRFVYMTTGHGIPDGKLWKYEAGPDTLVAEPILLGFFPATLDLTPDGLYALVVNFNLHGEPVPSTVSVVYTPDLVEVQQIETCVMPHGMRLGPSGTYAYSNCMMDDRLVEIDTRTFEVSRQFSVRRGVEGPWVEPEMTGTRDMLYGGDAPTCSPTWAEPSVDGRRIYVACNRGDWILEVDVVDWRVTRTLQTSRPGPYNLDASPDGRHLIATLKASDAVELFDLETGASVGVTSSSTTIPHGVVITPDSRYAFVSVEGVGAEPGKVDVFDLRDFRRVADVEVGQQASGITFWRMEPPG